MNIYAISKSYEHRCKNRDKVETDFCNLLLEHDSVPKRQKDTFLYVTLLCTVRYLVVFDADPNANYWVENDNK
jgi:hypothetical protein